MNRKQQKSQFPEFVGVRLSREERARLAIFAEKAGDPGNMSAGLRWALENAPLQGKISAVPIVNGGIHSLN